MTTLYLVRLPLRPAPLFRFATEQRISDPDPNLGYTCHAWLAALFGELAPRPFRYFAQRNEILGYGTADKTALIEHAQAFAPPLAWDALDAQGIAAKPMPSNWRSGKALRLEVLLCPVVRHGGNEKDAYLHALDRLGEAAPERADIYRQWFTERCGSALVLQGIEVRGMQSRASMLRRARDGHKRLMRIERPSVLLGATAAIADNEKFAALVASGIGRHRTFGFGMLLLAPAE
jgi:CRISPR system Cascade subunit CasE